MLISSLKILTTLQHTHYTLIFDLEDQNVV